MDYVNWVNGKRLHGSAEVTVTFLNSSKGEGNVELMLGAVVLEMTRAEAYDLAKRLLDHVRVEG